MSDHPPITCNNYSGYNVPTLWEILSEEDKDADREKAYWRQLSTWDNLATAVKVQRDRLEKALAKLEAKWPPAESEAAAEFGRHVREMVVHMEKTVQDASSTRAGLNGILSALATARREMQPLNEEYKKKSSDWKLRSWDNAEDELNEKAWGVMAKADRTVEQHVPQLRPTQPFRLNPVEPTTPVGPGGAARGGGRGSTFSGSGDAIVPPIEHSPPPPLPGAGSAGPDGSGAGGSGDAALGAGPGRAGGGLDLAGAPPVGGGPVIGDPGLPGNPGPGPGLPGGPGLGPVGGGGGGPVGGGGPFAVPAVPAAMPPGGLIPPAGGPARGSRGSGARPGGAPRPMPPGGVIGGAPMVGQGGRHSQGAKSRAAGRAGSGITPFAGVPAHGRSSDDPDETFAHGDPDNPWEVAEGVPPVIGPVNSEQRNDPGPGVIGMGA